MRNFVWIVVAVVIAGGAYLLYSGRTPQEIVEMADDAIGDEPVETTAEEAAVATEEAADETADVAEDAAATTEATIEETAEDAEAGLDNAADGAESLAEDAAEEAGDAVDATTEAAGDAADVAAETASDTADAIAETADDAADEVKEEWTATDAATAETSTDTTTDVTEATPPEELLTVEGFDEEQVSELIENAEIDAEQKLSLQSALERAQGDEGLLRETLDRIRDALGMDAQ